ncbi:Lsr2 family protein [Dactylosporangium sucinum]|uniref:Lsr2 family protein n=1 Tax=Dactylosporangium sucinum TaxID=1424081 RepID=A0A917X511_9ACTN|nr:Lsr2 family protein [Dactylosporangium sucinum]GGM76586.1 Lsr2 family protein [Dactylosporangium sucinum]
MARRVIHELIDDLDGEHADESVSFGLDGVMYAIDLSAKNAAELREAFAPFVTAATKVGRAATASGPARAGVRIRPVLTARAEREQNRAIREWAQSKGIEVSDRGRIRADLVERYHAEAGR